MIKPVFLIFCFLLPTVLLADEFVPHATYTVCFTPGQDCTQQIVSAIDSAKSDIWVQAYTFTSRPIGKALVDAKKRGVNIKIIFDKDALNQGKGTLKFFLRHQIPLWIDNQPAIAHNKVMVIDKKQVITGSFNFTRAAQQNNAENVLLITDANLAQKYFQNWLSRQQVSQIYEQTEKSPTLPIFLPQPQPISIDNQWPQLRTKLLNWLKSWV